MSGTKSDTWSNLAYYVAQLPRTSKPPTVSKGHLGVLKELSKEHLKLVPELDRLSFPRVTPETLSPHTISELEIERRCSL